MSWEDQWPYRITIYRHDWDVVQAWCEVYVGEFDQDWYRYGSDIANGVLGRQMPDVYRFRSDQHAVLFRLRWS